MTRLQELTDEQKIVGTVLLDRYDGHWYPPWPDPGPGPLTVAQIAAATAWPSDRTLGKARVARILRELHAEGIARRAGRGPEGVRWELDEAGYRAAGPKP